VNCGIEILIRLYSTLLWFYPPSFRAEFGSEMRAVFAEAAVEAAGRGWVPLGVLFLRELRDSPGAILQAHVGNLLKGGSISGRKDIIRPVTQWEAVLGALPLLVFGISSIAGKALQRYDASIVPYALTLLGLLIGWIHSFPLWSYTYVGSSLMIALINSPGYGIWVPLGLTALIGVF
jgi:hypothetical protein